MVSLAPRPEPAAPSELVGAARRAVSQLLERLDAKLTGPPASSDQQPLVEEISRHFSAMKLSLYGEPDRPPDKQLALELAREILRTSLLDDLLPALPHLDFECRKDITQVFSNLLRKQIDGQHPAVLWLEARPATLEVLLRGYAQSAVALHYGAMLREAVRHERLARAILPSDDDGPFYALFDYIESPYFDVASDAFASLKDILTKHKALVASFLDTAYTPFFRRFMRLVTSENYVTRRQSVKLLGELLLDRSNFAIMTRFIACADNLKVIMTLLRDSSSSIQYEAFHVFKIFVANPHKEGRVLDVLLRNQERLIHFLRDFQNERPDEQFVEEKGFLIKEISSLARPAAAPLVPPPSNPPDGSARPAAAQR
ncbi:hypothetical protein AB1Y20_007180 [Prymnesium parvum]|uniref:Calcium-binding protein 39 n=1 Tax=Prymnesium parvum TaxID=97485 RepID=A0AB34IXQ1_PRYPA